MQALYTIAAQCEWKLTCVYTNCDYCEDPLLKTAVKEFVLDSVSTVAETQLGPAAEALTRS
jgi:hypothetical protein